MLKAEELRIGNIVLSESDIIEIESLNYRGINIFPDGDVMCYYEDLEGVPLSEEWLLRMGFTIVPAPSAYGFDCNCRSEKYLLRGAWNGKSWFAYEILNNGTHKEFRFVHELQNLYYALTGTELTIKG